MTEARDDGLPALRQSSPVPDTTNMDLEEAHMNLVRCMHAVRRLPKLIEAENTLERETLIRSVSSDEDFFKENLNRTLKEDAESG